MLNHLYGVKVVVSPLMKTFSQDPVRTHKGMSKTRYSRRIQKKWNKRFGTIETRFFLRNDTQIICSQENFEYLKSNT